MYKARKDQGAFCKLKQKKKKKFKHPTDTEELLSLPCG